jgi:hypothetical protein
VTGQHLQHFPANVRVRGTGAESLAPIIALK